MHGNNSSVFVGNVRASYNLLAWLFSFGAAGEPAQQNKTANTDLTTGFQRRLCVVLIRLVSLFIEYSTGNGLGLVFACRANNTEVTVVDAERKLYSYLLIFK